MSQRFSRRSMDEFRTGDKVLLQHHQTLRWTIRGTVKDARVPEDSTNRSFIIIKDNGNETIRNARHMKFQALAAERKVCFSDSEDEAPAVAEPAVASADTQRVESSGPAQRTRQAGRLAVGVRHAC